MVASQEKSLVGGHEKVLGSRWETLKYALGELNCPCFLGCFFHFQPKMNGLNQGQEFLSVQAGEKTALEDSLQPSSVG